MVKKYSPKPSSWQKARMIESAVMNSSSEAPLELNNDIRMKQAAKIIIRYLIDEGLLDMEDRVIKKTLKKTRRQKTTSVKETQPVGQH